MSNLLLVCIYLASMFNMLVINTLKYPENLPYIVKDLDVWLYPAIKDVLESRKD